MTNRRFEVYEVRECEHGEVRMHPIDPHVSLEWCENGWANPASSIPDDLLEEAARRIRNSEPTSSQDMARAAFSVLFPDGVEE